MSAVKEKVWYTPGEWRVVRSGRSIHGASIRSDEDGGAYIALLSGERADTPANARLIAAAPDLLEYGQAVESACTDFMADPYNEDAHERLKMSLGDLRTAISKARGQS